MVSGAACPASAIRSRNMDRACSRDGIHLSLCLGCRREARHMSEALSETQAALARAGLAALDGLAAAAAHELGSPLATIAVVSNELSREIPADSPLAEDVQLLLSQSERCRDILADIAAEPEERGGMPF